MSENCFCPRRRGGFVSRRSSKGSRFKANLPRGLRGFMRGRSAFLASAGLLRIFLPLLWMVCFSAQARQLERKSSEFFPRSGSLDQTFLAESSLDFSSGRGLFSGENPEEAEAKREPSSDSSHTGKLKKLKVKSLSDLKSLTPFESVSVIQKKYLPKTRRGELNLSPLAYILNNYFFYQAGMKGHAGFFFREKHGIGLEALGFFRWRRPVSSELEKQQVIPTNPVYTQFYGGAYYKWSPVFGKFAVLNRKIIYFDMFFKFGGGAVKVIGLTDEQLKRLPEGQVKKLKREILPSGAFGVGQTFALTKNWGFTWEFQWLGYWYQYYGGDNSLKGSLHNDLLLSFGVNYYFPGASYR